jgi:hypothetical protein
LSEFDRSQSSPALIDADLFFSGCPFNLLLGDERRNGGHNTGEEDSGSLRLFNLLTGKRLTIELPHDARDSRFGLRAEKQNRKTQEI